MNIKSEIIIKFRHDIGAELKRQRLKRGWSVEQAVEKFNLGHPLVLERVERGASQRFYLIFALIAFYNCKNRS